MCTAHCEMTSESRHGEQTRHVEATSATKVVLSGDIPRTQAWKVAILDLFSCVRQGSCVPAVTSAASDAAACGKAL